VERDKLIDTHDVVPILAYDAEEEMIDPRLYEETLVGSVVLAYFGLVQRFVRANNRVVFTTVLWQITVLRQLIKEVKSAFKRGDSSATPPRKRVKLV
jgi:hypothetical protein